MNPDKTAIEKRYVFNDPSDNACCAHKRVEERREGELTVTRTWWECVMCGLEFTPKRAALSEAKDERWISVEERLPGPVENPEKFGFPYWGLYIVCVLAPNISERPIVIPATWVGKWRNDGGFDLNVTHWQPLPAPPKEKP